MTLITRLRLDAALYEATLPRAAGQKGRPRRKGKRLPALAKRLSEPDTLWSRVRVRWYGGAWRWLEVTSEQAVWHHSGLSPVALRWVLVRDPQGRFEPQALLSTDPDLPAAQIIDAFVRRWSMEVTFQEVRAHLGVEGRAPMERLGRRSLYSVVSGALFVRGVAGPTPARLAGVCAPDRVVPGGTARLLGCARPGPTLPLATTDFLHVR